MNFKCQFHYIPCISGNLPFDLGCINFQIHIFNLTVFFSKCESRDCESGLKGLFNHFHTYLFKTELLLFVNCLENSKYLLLKVKIKINFVCF